MNRVIWLLASDAGGRKQIFDQIQRMLKLVFVIQKLYVCSPQSLVLQDAHYSGHCCVVSVLNISHDDSRSMFDSGCLVFDFKSLMTTNLTPEYDSGFIYLSQTFAVFAS